MTIAFLAVAFLAVLAYELPGMVKNKEWRELAVFSGFMALAMTMAFAEALGLPLPNPNRGLELIFDPMAKMMYRLLS